jgi:hypothetical protein
MVATLALACAVLAIAGARATAAMPAIAIATTPDPVASLTTQLIVTGTLTAPGQVAVVHVESPGGACGASPWVDPGPEALWATPGPGAYLQRVDQPFTLPGTYLLCGWVEPSGARNAPVLASTVTSVTVRPPHVSLALTAPRRVLAGRRFQVATRIRTEARRDVHVALLAVTTCPPTWAAASATRGERTLLAGPSTGGPLVATTTARVARRGRYRICGYADDGEAATPAATASVRLTVLARRR